VVFTSSDDDSVGDTIADSCGNPSASQAYYAEYINEEGYGTNAVLSNVRFSYAGIAYEGGGISNIFTDCQFIQCGQDAIRMSGGVSLYMICSADAEPS
jgi:hypothetical protein